MLFYMTTLYEKKRDFFEFLFLHNFFSQFFISYVKKEGIFFNFSFCMKKNKSLSIKNR